MRKPDARVVALTGVLACSCGVSTEGTRDAPGASGWDGSASAAEDGGQEDDAGEGSPPDAAEASGGDSGGTGAGAEGGGPNGDASLPVDLDGGTTFVVVTPISGIPLPTKTPLHGPGLVLMGGGTDVDAAFVWMHDTIAGSPTATVGNVIVFDTQSPPPSLDNGYTAYVYGLAPFQSVQTLYLGGYKNDGNNAAPATATDVEIAAYYVSRADAVFFAGGDQADYVSWSQTSPALVNALAALYARGGVVGGTSAGCAIMGAFVFDDLRADDQGADPATVDVIANPYEASVSFTRDMFAWPSLLHVLADPHFVTRDRFGRMAGFLARQYGDGFAPDGVLGVGIDESNALVVDSSGVATLLQQPGGTEASAGTGAYVVQPSGAATRCTSGAPLLYENLAVTHLSVGHTQTTPGDTFDFTRGCGTGTRFLVTVDGSNTTSPYSPAPYAATGAPTACP